MAPTDLLRNRTVREAGWFALALVISVVATFISPALGHIGVLALLWATLGTAWNIMGGLTGMLSLGQAAFFGVGAYTSTLLFLNLGISPWIGVFAAAGTGAILAVLIGWPTLRLTGPYFALATVAAPVILAAIAVANPDLTRGTLGLIVPFNPDPWAMVFPDQLPFVFIAAGLLALAMIVMSLATRGRWRVRLTALRDDENAARSLGVQSSRIKIGVAMISGALTGMVGAIYAQYIAFITPTSVFSLDISIDAIMVAVIGGIGGVSAGIIGGFVLVALRQLVFQQFLGDFPGLDTLIIGTVLLIFVIVFYGRDGSVLKPSWLRMPRRQAREVGDAT